jgi:hypothetical protein
MPSLATARMALPTSGSTRQGGKGRIAVATHELAPVLRAGRLRLVYSAASVRLFLSTPLLASTGFKNAPV